MYRVMWYVSKHNTCSQQVSQALSIFKCIEDEGFTLESTQWPSGDAHESGQGYQGYDM